MNDAAEIGFDADPASVRQRPAQWGQSVTPPSYQEAVQPIHRPHTYRYPLSSPSHRNTFTDERSSTGSARSQDLHKPIAIPATSSSLGSPFVRVYPPALGKFDITRDRFLEFLDGLNRVAVKSPPLQVLGLVGDIVGFVPLAAAQIVGSSVKAVGTLGTIAMSKGGTEIYLRKANQDLFFPRGLEVQTAKLEAVARVAGIPILDSGGKIRKNASLLDPILSMEDTTSTARWLAAMQPWTAQLDLEDLPQINMETHWLGRLHTMASERERSRNEKKMMTSRRKIYDKQQEDEKEAHEDREKDLRKLEKKEEKARRKDDGRKLEKKLLKVEKKRQKVETKFEKDNQKKLDGVRKDDKDSKKMKQILWLVIKAIDGNDR